MRTHAHPTNYRPQKGIGLKDEVSIFDFYKSLQCVERSVLLQRLFGKQQQYGYQSPHCDVDNLVFICIIKCLEEIKYTDFRGAKLITHSAINTTVCPIRSDPFYLVTYYINYFLDTQYMLLTIE